MARNLDGETFGNIDRVIFPKESAVLLARSSMIPRVLSVGVVGFYTMSSAFAVIRIPEGVDTRKTRRVDFRSLEIDLKSNLPEAMELALRLLSKWTNSKDPLPLYDFNRANDRHTNFDGSQVNKEEIARRNRSLTIIRDSGIEVPIGPLFMTRILPMLQQDGE